MLDTYYYVVLIAWVSNVFFSSWSPDAPWGNPNLTGEEAVTRTLSMTLLDIEPSVTTCSPLASIVWRNVGFSAKCWVLM
jgi:hypothetical protein